MPNEVFVFRVIHLAVLFCQNVQINRSWAISSHNSWPIVVPAGFVQSISANLLVGDWQLQISSEVEDADIAFVVYCGEETWVSWMPGYIIDVVLWKLECSEGIFALGVPKLYCPIIWACKNQIIEEVEFWGVIDWEAADRSVMFIKDRHFLVSLVVKRSLIEHSIQRTNVIIVGISCWETWAWNVDLVLLFFRCFLEYRGSFWSNRVLRSHRGAIQSCGSCSLSCLPHRAHSTQTAHFCRFVELFDVPRAKHSIVGKGDNIVSNLRSDYR